MSAAALPLPPGVAGAAGGDDDMPLFPDDTIPLFQASPASVQSSSSTSGSWTSDNSEAEEEEEEDEEEEKG